MGKGIPGGTERHRARGDTHPAGGCPVPPQPPVPSPAPPWAAAKAPGMLSCRLGPAPWKPFGAGAAPRRAAGSRWDVLGAASDGFAPPGAPPSSTLCGVSPPRRQRRGDRVWPCPSGEPRGGWGLVGSPRFGAGVGKKEEKLHKGVTHECVSDAGWGAAPPRASPCWGRWRGHLARGLPRPFSGRGGAAPHWARPHTWEPWPWGGGPWGGGPWGEPKPLSNACGALVMG